jgi:exosortase/archaeosortase family protein
LVLLAALFVGLSAVIRPRPAQAAGGAAAAFLGALLGNAFRVALLTLGMVSPWAGSVAEGPGHEAIGLLTLAFSALPLILWARRIARAGEADLNPADWSRETAVIPQAAPTVGKGRRLLAWGFLAAAVAVNLAPPRPLDVSRSVPSLYAPKVLNGRMGEAVPLEPKEREYFLKYGGQALKTRYGDRALLLVRTSAPFRHLHAPDECLRGLGYQVQSAGFRPGPLPATEYRAAGPDGRIWRVSVTFLSDQGDKTPNMTEALWRWLIQPGSVWTAVQRIRPWDEPLAEPDSSGPDAWEQAVAAALDAHDWPTPERLSTPGLLAARPDFPPKRGTP